MNMRINLRIFKPLWVIAAFSIMVVMSFSGSGFCRNWDWDQNHDCVEAEGGNTGWGKWGYDGTMHGEYTIKECCEQYCKACPVYANTGRYQKTVTDLSVPGVGPALNITRTYNSQEWSSSLLGYSWTFNFGKKLIITRNKNGKKIIGVLLTQGEKNYYREDLDGTLTRLTNYGATYDLIKKPNNTYAIYNKNGSRYELHEDGKIDKVIDRNQNKLVFSYNLVGCLNRITNASGNYIDFQLGPNGKIASVSDNLGRTIAYGYDDNGNLITVTDPLGHTTQYTYNSNNFLTQIIDARRNVVETASYDNNQPPRISSFTEKGETYTIAYFDGRTEKTDSKGNKWAYYFNDVGVIERVVDPLGNVKEQQLNKITSTSVDWEEDLNGNRRTYTYDTDGNINSETDPLGNVWTYTYIAGTDFVETATLPLGMVTKYEYDTRGNLNKVIRDFGGPLENVTIYDFDSYGQLISLTDPLGHTSQYEYNISGNLIKFIDSLYNIRTYTYDYRGNKITDTDSNGNTTTFSYDILDRLISSKNPAGHTTTYTYDANDNQVIAQLPNGQKVEYLYDTYNRLIKSIDPLGNIQEYDYDHNDNLIAQIDASGNSIQYIYDVLGRKIQEINVANNQTNFTYDAVGNMVAVINAKGNSTTFIYDSLNRLTRKANPDGTYFTFAYDALGNKVGQTDANGNTIAYTYDSLNRMIRRNYPDGSTANFTYDILGQMISGVTPTSSLRYRYDAIGHVTSSTQNGKTIYYGYDAIGNRVSLTTPEGETLQYIYSNANFMTQIQLSNNYGINYSYDFMGKVVNKNYTGGMSATYSFDKIGRLVSLNYQEVDGTDLYNQINSFDDLGNVIQQTTKEGTTLYTYDKTYQLTEVDYSTTNTERFTYDPVGNRLTSSGHADWTYNNRNELESYGGIDSSYDSNGNMVTQTEAGKTTVYQYNYENRLIRIELPDGDYITYKYDVRGRRVKKNINGTVTEYLYAGNNLLAEYDTVGILHRNYFYGPGDLNPSILVQNGKSYFYLKDHLDTPQKVVDENGDIVWFGEYKAFGDLSITIDTLENNFRFPGQYFDSESGLHYNYYRYYDNATGRYLREDPIGFNGGINLYIYAQNNAINLIDFFGLEVGVSVCVRPLASWWAEAVPANHAYIQIGAWSAGFQADDTVHIPEDNPTHSGKKCWPAKKAKKGKMADGTPCKCVTDKDIQKCIKNAGHKGAIKGGYPSYSWHSNNCGDWVINTLDKCCMKGNIPWHWYGPNSAN